MSSHTDSAKSNWRTVNKELLLALADLVLVTLSTRDVQESRLALKRYFIYFFLPCHLWLLLMCQFSNVLDMERVTSSPNRTAFHKTWHKNLHGRLFLKLDFKICFVEQVLGKMYGMLFLPVSRSYISCHHSLSKDVNSQWCSG